MPKDRTGNQREADLAMEMSWNLFHGQININDESFQNDFVPPSNPDSETCEKPPAVVNPLVQVSLWADREQVLEAIEKDIGNTRKSMD